MQLLRKYPPDFAAGEVLLQLQHALGGDIGILLRTHNHHGIGALRPAGGRGAARQQGNTGSDTVQSPAVKSTMHTTETATVTISHHWPYSQLQRLAYSLGEAGDIGVCLQYLMQASHRRLVLLVLLQPLHLPHLRP